VGFVSNRLLCLVLAVLGKRGGLTVRDIAEAAGVDRRNVQAALKRLETLGLVGSRLLEMEYYGRKRLSFVPVRLYSLTDEGFKFVRENGLNFQGEVKAGRLVYTVEDFKGWGRQPEGFYNVMREHWKPFKAWRESVKAKR